MSLWVEVLGHNLKLKGYKTKLEELKGVFTGFKAVCKGAVVTYYADSKVPMIEVGGCPREIYEESVLPYIEAFFPGIGQSMEFSEDSYSVTLLGIVPIEEARRATEVLAMLIAHERWKR